MLRKNKILTILFGCLILISLSRASFANRKNDVEVFIGGKRYVSFKQYQIKRLKSTLKLNYISSNYENFSQYKEKLLRNYNEKDYRGISKEELTQVLNELDADSSEGKTQIVENSLDEMKEMQKMLDNRSQSGAKDISIDPDKLKTIVVKPSTP